MVNVVYGVTGQVGSYLTEKLLAGGETVIGVARRTSSPNTSRISHILDKITLVSGDVTDPFSVNRVISTYKPDRLYHLAAQSFVKASFDQPKYTWETIAGGTQNILESVLTHCPSCRVLHMSSSEMYGDNHDVDWHGHTYQDEETVFKPCSPYAVAKVAAHHTIQLYRKAYNLFTCNAIVFNNESPRRGNEFVTQKIVQWAASQYKYLLEGPPKEKIKLGNLFAKRDWSHSSDIVEGIYLLINHKEPIDCVFASGQTHSVLDFLCAVIRKINVKLDARGVYTIDKSLFRPSDVEFLRGKPDKAMGVLGWSPKIKFEELVNEMLENALRNRS